MYNYCKEHSMKILYLLPRQVVKDEFIKELQGDKEKNEPDKTDVIKVFTYQQFEKKEIYPSFYPYDIIICDECHYFVSDSTIQKIFPKKNGITCYTASWKECQL